MRANPRNGGFTIRKITTKQHGFTYTTHLLAGYIEGVRIRKQFRSREEALGEKNRLDVQAANSGEIRTRQHAPYG